MKIKIGSDGRMQYDGVTLADMPFRKSFPITCSGLEDAEILKLLDEQRFAVKVLLDEVAKRKRKKQKKG